METLKRIANQYLDGLITTDEFWSEAMHVIANELNPITRAAVALLLAEDWANDRYTNDIPEDRP